MHISKRQIAHSWKWWNEDEHILHWTMCNYNIDWSIAHQCFIYEDSDAEDVRDFWEYLETGILKPS